MSEPIINHPIQSCLIKGDKSLPCSVSMRCPDTGVVIVKYGPEPTTSILEEKHNPV